MADYKNNFSYRGEDGASGEAKPIQAILVGVVTRDEDLEEIEVSLDELARLLDTAGGEVFARVIQAKASPDPRTVIGSGKVEEIAALLGVTVSAVKMRMKRGRDALRIRLEGAE